MTHLVPWGPAPRSQRKSREVDGVVGPRGWTKRTLQSPKLPGKGSSGRSCLLDDDVIYCRLHPAAEQGSEVYLNFRSELGFTGLRGAFFLGIKLKIDFPDF